MRSFFEPLYQAIAIEVVKMLTPELQAKFDELNQFIAAEKVEAQAAIKQAVEQAVKPLESQLTELKAMLAASGDPGEILGQLSESIEAIKGIVTVESTEPTEPAE